ncbi:MAG: tetratricopeptide repeat protein, partial [bacterium]|nr:tetratricopeptide repeat protein [bacterium]
MHNEFVRSRATTSNWLVIGGVLVCLLFSPACSSPEPEPVPVEAPPEVPAAPEVSIAPVMTSIPEPNWDEFPDEVRKQIHSVYDPAAKAPDDHEAVGKLGMMLHGHMLHEEAQQGYQRARALAPDEFRWTYYLGIVSDSLDDRPTATALIRRATELDPEYAPARVRLADQLLEVGELEECEEHYRKAIEIDPKLASAHHGLGKLHVARKEWTAAVAAY